MTRTPTEIDLGRLETLISSVRPDCNVPLTRWRRRLESIARRCGNFSLAEQQHLKAVIERIVELERTVGAQRGIS